LDEFIDGYLRWRRATHEATSARES
jgi:hypothetical protein